VSKIGEGLSDREFERLHLTTELEDLLLDRAQPGSSIILTGNAGDGKTHLARAIERRLGPTAARFEFALDATALMTRQRGALPVLERWR
jgi:adenylylsulfate kinase-like enzyme